MPSPRTRAAAVASICCVLTLLLAGCSSGDKARPKQPEKTPSAATATPKRVPTSPVTGLPARGGLPDHKVLVVKIENTGNGAPQTGVKQADLVYEELVEGGLTRLGAFFYSRTPDSVGHVRSARATDIDMVRPTGGLLIASGAAGRTIARIKAAHVGFLSEDTDNLVLRHDPAKARPYDRLVDLATVAKTAAATSHRVPKPFLPFGPTSSFTGTGAATSFSVTFSPDSTTRWDFAKGAYTRTNGHAAPGEEFKAASVLVLTTAQGDAGYLDPAGNPVPETLLTGRGAAQLFHDGRREIGRWSKKSSSAPFVLTTKAGRTMSVPAGRTWMELIPKDAGRVDIAR